MSRSIRPVSTFNRATIGPLAKRHPNCVSLLRRADTDPRLDDGWAKAQPAVVLILKRLRKRGHGFKSHPTNWEKPRIKPGAPWFTRHMLPETQFSCLWPCSLAITSTGRMGFLWFNVQEHPEAQPAVVLVLKRLRRWVNGLKSHPTDWDKMGIEPATPDLQDIGLSET